MELIKALTPRIIAFIALCTIVVMSVSGEFAKTTTELRTLDGVEYTCNVFEANPAPYGFEGYSAFCGTYGFFGNLEPSLFIETDGTIIRI